MQPLTRTLFAAGLALGLSIWSLPAAPTPDGYYEVSDGGTELLRILETLPYAAEGEGPVFYTFEFSECGYCQRKYRDFRGQDLGVQFRRMFVPVSERAARETAALGLSRDPQDYHLFMQGRKAAPQFNRNNDAINVHNAIVQAASRDIPPILIRNGWDAKGLVYPAFVWIEGDKVYANGGYDRANFEGAIARAKAGWNDASAALLARVSGGASGPAPAAVVGAAAGATPSAAGPGAPRPSTAARPLDALTAFFVYHKLVGQQPDFDQLASQTNKVQTASMFNKARTQAAEAAALRAHYEAADPAATYSINIQARLTYQLEQQRFDVDIFQEGSVLPLQPFRDAPHMMPQHAHRHYGVQMAFANAGAARFVPLAADRARVINSVAQHGVAGAAAEVTFRFLDAKEGLPRLARAEIESVRYAYDRRIVGFVPMTNPALWPLPDPIAVAAVDREALASQPRPIDNLTALFIYHKLANDPLDLEAIARHTHTVTRAGAFDKDQATAAMAATLREKFDAADPTATYTITMRTRLNYDMNQARYEVETFGPDRYLPIVPFRPQGGGFEPHSFADVRRADGFNRRLMFLNADAARYIPMAPAEARTLGPGPHVIAEVQFTFADTADDPVDANKTLRAQITSVRYAPGTGRMTANWPLPEPIAVNAATVAADAGPRTNRIDDVTVFFIHHKLTGEPVDFEGIGAMLDKVARAGQFEKSEVLAAAVADMRSRFDATDAGATYSLRVQTNLKYDLEQERFAVELFEPGRHLLYRPLVALGVHSRHSAQAQAHLHKLVFANGDASRYLPLPRDEAAKIGQVARLGTTGATADVEFRFVGTGDPTGAVEGRTILRAEILALRFDGLDLPVTVRPYDPQALPELSVDRFDIVGLKTGVPLTTLQRTIEKEFGPIGAIRPRNNEDPRLVSGIGHNPDGCFSFGNKVAEVGNVCIRAFADERGIVRKIIVEQILEGTDWEPVREALLQKYGAMSESIRQGNVQHYAWGPEVAEPATLDYRGAPQRALTASVSAIQSTMDRMAASTRASTNLRIRLIDPAWAGAPAPAPEAPRRSSGAAPRL